MKLQMIFFVMDALTVVSLPILYVYEKLRKLGRPSEDATVVKPVVVR